MRKINSDKVFGFVNGLLLVLILLIMVYPLYFVIIASISDPIQVGQGKLVLLPKGFTLDSYKEAFREKQIWVGYRNSIYYTVVGTLFNLFLTVPTAYALSKKKMRFHGALTFYYVFTMYFGGGMIPTFLVVKGVGLYDTLGALFIPQAVNVFNFIVMRTFFRNLPESLEEAARIDGASYMQVLVKIVLPLSLPIIATIGLFYAVGYWNTYFDALLYIQDPNKYTLQLRLRSLLFGEELNNSGVNLEGLGTQVMTQSLKMATVAVSTIPILIVYPWLQKYFVKGVMVGSVKG